MAMFTDPAGEPAHAGMLSCPAARIAVARTGI